LRLNCVTGRRCPAFLVNPLRYLPSRFEGGDALFGHHDLLTGTRVAGFMGLPPLHLEDAEVAKFDPAVPNERIHDGVEYLLTICSAWSRASPNSLEIVWMISLFVTMLLLE
jgi:hypothetical protein